MRGLDAEEYAAILQASTQRGAGDVAICRRLIARGLLTGPEVIPGLPHHVVRLNGLGLLALRCHEAAKRTVF